MRVSIIKLCEETEYFIVKIEVHQGFALSSYLFSFVLDEFTKGVQDKHFGK